MVIVGRHINGIVSDGGYRPPMSSARIGIQLLRVLLWRATRRWTKGQNIYTGFMY
jgi:hypothetical protein